MPNSRTPRYRAARLRLDPVFARIAEGTVHRETERVLPRAEVHQLRDAGIGRLRVPTEYGGDGLSLPEIAEILVDLAEVDSNLAQIFRGHVVFVEGKLHERSGPARDAWLRRIAAGDLVGNAWSESGSALGETATKLTRSDGRVSINGRKFYTTGSIFADWADVSADSDGEEVTATVRTDQPGVRIDDDWDGFGQRLTGTGTIVLTNALVDEADVTLSSAQLPYHTALFQLVLLAVHAGIASAVERDTAAEVAGRGRAYSHGSGTLPREDPIIQSIAGGISATAFAARSLVRGVATAIQDASDALDAGDPELIETTSIIAEIRSAQAQVVLSSIVPDAATALFGTLGASATRAGKSLDRHWRNARAVASHNPAAYKQRIVGDWAINGTRPQFTWRVGNLPVITATEESETAR